MTLLRVLAAFVRRDWLTTRSYRLDFVLELAGVLVELTMYFFIGRLVDRLDFGGRSEITGSYFAFVVIGFALLNLLSTALVAISSTLRTEQTTGSLEALLLTPQPSILAIIGTSSFSFIRATLQMVLYLGFAAAFFGLRFEVNAWSLLVSAVALVASLELFGALGIALASATLVFKRTSALLGLLSSAMALLGGVYFPVTLLPGPLRIIAEANPFTWAVSVLRQGMLEGTVDVGRLLLLVVTANILLPVAVRIMNAALDRSRREGSLVQY